MANVLPSGLRVASISTSRSTRLSTQSLLASAHDRSSYADRNAWMKTSSGARLGWHALIIIAGPPTCDVYSVIALLSPRTRPRLFGPHAQSYETCRRLRTSVGGTIATDIWC